MPHYFDKNTNVESKRRNIKINIFDKSYTFVTDNNVFSKTKLDFGTRTLLLNIDVSNIKGRVLDFGCGYGTIGIIIKSVSDSCVDMVDINERALNLARLNASINNVHVNIFSSDIYSNVKGKYDYIITNPPIRVGKEILYNILINAKNHLHKKGHLIFVINKDQGAKSTINYLKEYYLVNVIAKNKGFFVVDCQND